MTHQPTSRAAFGAALLTVLLGCGTSAPAGGQAPAPTPSAASTTAPLAGFAGRRVGVWPTQRVAPGDSLGWSRSLPGGDSTLRVLDDTLGAVLARRGLEGQWVTAPQLMRMGRRNASFVHDPRRLTVTVLGATRRTGEPVVEPLITQLRGLAGVADTRFALVPAELRFGSAGDGTGRAVLRLALVDVRTTQLLWLGEVASDPASAYSPTLATQLAERIADLILPR